MEIVIWGTAVKGKAVKKICDSKGWKVKAFVDNDETKWGNNLKGIPVLSPAEFAAGSEEDIQIWIATGAEEVYSQAKRIAANVLDWKYIQAILESQSVRPPFPEIQLGEEHLQNCELLNIRRTMLQRFASESRKWEMAEIGVAFRDFSEEILKPRRNWRSLLIMNLTGCT